MKTSKDLDIIQKSLLNTITSELKAPMIDFEKVRELINVVESVDIKRRKTWHREKFGVYEKIAKQAIKDNKEQFDSDDIPF